MISVVANYLYSKEKRKEKNILVYISLCRVIDTFVNDNNGKGVLIQLRRVADAGAVRLE